MSPTRESIGAMTDQVMVDLSVIRRLVVGNEEAQAC